MTRTWQDAVEDIRTGERHGFPQPGTVLPLLRRWQSDYAHAAWDRPAPGRAGRAAGPARHAQVLRAAQAFSSLQSIRPFPDGNGRICRLLAHGILRQGGYPASGLSAVMERHRPTCNARLMDVMRSGDQTAWTKAFIGFAEEGARTIADQIPAMASAQQALAGRIAAGTPEQRAAIAADMLTTPFDRPAVFSKRHGLDKETTEAILKPLVRSGDLELGRINGHQVMMLPVGLEMLRELTRRQPQAHRDPDTRTRDGERAPRRDPDPRL
jgi:hypothetical protein